MPEDRALSFLQLIRRSQRGKLKIYLGYRPGVGKTWQMLLEGRRLKQESIDMVVGFVETTGERIRPSSSRAWKWFRENRFNTEAYCLRRWTWKQCWRATPK